MIPTTHNYQNGGLKKNAIVQLVKVFLCFSVMNILLTGNQTLNERFT